MSIKKIVFHNMQIGLEDIMEQFDSSGKEMYEDIVEELMEDASDRIDPVGFWTEVRVSHVSDEQVKLDEEEKNFRTPSDYPAADKIFRDIF